MQPNPCLRCQLKNQDKNNPKCTSCDKRIGYLSHLEKELSFAMTNTDQRLSSPRLPAFASRTHLLSAITDT
jgi:hypothetical protein